MMREVLIVIVVVQMGRAALLACWARVCEDAEELGGVFLAFSTRNPGPLLFHSRSVNQPGTTPLPPASHSPQIRHLMGRRHGADAPGRYVQGPLVFEDVENRNVGQLLSCLFSSAALPPLIISDSSEVISNRPLVIMYEEIRDLRRILETKLAKLGLRLDRRLIKWHCNCPLLL